jgi:hypothetical protein
MKITTKYLMINQKVDKEFVDYVRPKTEIVFDLKNINLPQNIFRHFQLGYGSVNR